MTIQEIKKFLDSKNSIFKTLKISIGLEGVLNNSDDASKMYKIKSITTDYEPLNKNKTFQKIDEFIVNLNSEIQNSQNTGFKEKDSGWSIFFLIKECIQILSKEEFGFNFYRGQRDGSWETIPSVFRDYTDDFGNMYYEQFENIYKEVHKRFPDKITYVDFPIVTKSKEFSDIMEQRGRQLALLQHYELYTALLDITSNPYIALLFMTNGSLDKPQIEFFDISNTPLFMEPENNVYNNRIKVQRGAFLNYELLLSMTENNKNILDELNDENNKEKSDKYKIPRIVLSIEYLDEDTKSGVENEVNKSEKFRERFKDNEDINKLVNESMIRFDPDANRKSVYDDVLKHLRQKLAEFQYFEEDLFPDFEDFLKNSKKHYMYSE